MSRHPDSGKRRLRHLFLSINGKKVCNEAKIRILIAKQILISNFQMGQSEQPQQSPRDVLLSFQPHELSDEISGIQFDSQFIWRRLPKQEMRPAHFCFASIRKHNIQVILADKVDYMNPMPDKIG